MGKTKLKLKYVNIRGIKSIIIIIIIVIIITIIKIKVYTL